MKTTLNKIRKFSPCESGWTKLLKHLGKTQADDEPLPLLAVLESNDLDAALWCLRAVDGHDKEKRLFAVWCARQVQHLMTDPRSIAALDVAEGFANGEATREELKAAWAAAEDAARAAAAAAWAAAWAAARAAADAAMAVACAAAEDAAWSSACAAERDAAGGAAVAARAVHESMFIKMCEGSAPWQRSTGENLLPITVLLEEV